MNPKVKGSICGIVAAVCYGTNPLGALPLYAQGIGPQSVLLYRFAVAALLLALLMVARRQSLAVSARELAILLPLGALFAVSSLTLFISFHYLDAGVASTILFVYPVMVAVIMTVFFRERLTAATVVSIGLALCGIVLLSNGDGGKPVSAFGIVLVLVSSLSYAIYIVAVNRSPLRMSSFALTFYVLLAATATVAAYAAVSGNSLQWLHGASQWAPALMLAVLPTIMSLVLMAVAVRLIGSTPTAIMGALEPLTAVLIGIGVFGEPFTMRLAVGIVLILVAVMLIIAGKSLSTRPLKAAIGFAGHMLHTVWLWK